MAHNRHAQGTAGQAAHGSPTSGGLRLGIEHFPSQANFVTARLDADELAGALAGAGIVIRPGSDLGMPGWVRITVGWAPQMAVLRSALRALAGRAADGKTAVR
jgi:histidinol-phosphate/aromatic aminotransferase/cobyric acid decarboxylase-like protein